MGETSEEVGGDGGDVGGDRGEVGDRRGEVGDRRGEGMRQPSEPRGGAAKLGDRFSDMGPASATTPATS